VIDGECGNLEHSAAGLDRNLASVVRGDHPLRAPGFPRLATSYAINQTGDLLGVVALAILVLDETGEPLATTALFVAAKFLPAFAAPWLTAQVDGFATRAALPTIYAIEALAFAALAVLAGSFSLPLVLAIAFVDGTLALTARGLSRAAVAAILGDQLRAGNAILNVAFAVTGMLGPALAGVIVGAWGVATALYIDAASFAAIALLLLASRHLPGRRPRAHESWIARVRDGLGYVWQRPLLRRLVGLEALAFVFFTLIVPIEVVYAKETLDAGDAGFGALLAAWGIGLTVGSLLFARVKNGPIALLVGASTLCVGTGYLGLAFAPGIISACFASVIGGIGNGVQWVAVLTAVQEAVSESYQARVVGLLESIGAAMPGIGYVLGGALTAIWSPRVAYFVAGVGVILVAVAMTRRLAAAAPA
jgi:MFS family permease